MTIEEVRSAYRNTFSTDNGRVVLEDLTRSFAARPSFDRDALVMAHKEGQRDVVLRILALLEPEPKPSEDEE